MKPDSSHVNMEYRPEIDGLRALAVLPVILFHAGFHAFGGGFVGVDVFFVISGYLITSIIINDLQVGQFSIGRFYERRARRILPALFLVMLVCVPFAWLWLLPAEMREFSRSVISVLAFVPNIYFWLTTNYFAASAENLPLLHTWSLGVEEQFYVLFPLLLWWGWRFGLVAIGLCTAVMAMLSMGASEWAWRTGKFSANFFLAPTRAWELASGALMAMAWRNGPIHGFVRPFVSNAASLFGLLLLLAAVLFFKSTTPTPSVYALVPVGGTLLIIGFAGPQTLVYRLLSHKWLVGIGLISYSAYLWHQPLFAFARIRFDSEQPVVVMLALSVASLLLAYLTWAFVEKPFRKKSAIPVLDLIKYSAVGAGALLVFSVISEWTNGFRDRIPAADWQLADYADSTAQGSYVTKRFRQLQADFDANDNRRKVLVVGDSYAEDLVNALVESDRFSGIQLRTYRIPPECQIYLASRNVSAYIEPARQAACDRIRNSSQLKTRIASANAVILASSWRDWAIESLPETIELMQLKADQSLFVVGPKHVGAVNVRQLLRLPAQSRASYMAEVSPEIVRRDKVLSEMLPKHQYVSMQVAVCGAADKCLQFTSSGDLVSFDGRHLTKAGAALAGRSLASTSTLSLLADLPR